MDPKWSTRCSGPATAIELADEEGNSRSAEVFRSFNVHYKRARRMSIEGAMKAGAAVAGAAASGATAAAHATQVHPITQDLYK